MLTSKIEDITVLIAEDEEKLLEPMVEYLQLFFKHVYGTVDGESALELYKKHRPQIMIVDILMPKLDGLGLIRKIRETDNTTRMIITTAYSDREKLLQAVELRLEKYLIKPIQSDEIKKLLFEVVEDIRNKQTIIPLKSGYSWDKKHQKLLYKQEEIGLNYKERKVLALLIQRSDTAVSAIDIYNCIYAEEPERDYSSYAVTSLIKRLRQKLPKGMIKSVYGNGYIFARN